MLASFSDIKLLVKKKTLFFSFCFLSCTILSAQITFQKTYSDGATNSVIATIESGGYLIGGTTSDLGGNAMVFLMKLDTIGNIIWTKKYGGPGHYNFGGISQTKDSGYIITGNTYVQNNTDIYLVKTNNAGDTLWTRSYGGIDSEIGNSVVQTPGGDFIIAGNKYYSVVGIPDAYLVRTDSAGNLLWAKTYGGFQADEALQVLQTSNGELILNCLTKSFGAGINDNLLIKLLPSGATLWRKCFGSQENEYPGSVAFTSDSGFILVGETYSLGESALYLVRTDGNGDTLWARAYYQVTESREVGYKVLQTLDGGFIVAGQTEYYDFDELENTIRMFLLKVDANGSIVWARSYGRPGFNYGTSVLQTPDSGFLITGSSDGFGSLSGMYLVKTDPDGKSFCNEKDLIMNSSNIAFEIATFSLAAVVQTPDEKSPLTIVDTGATQYYQCITGTYESPSLTNRLVISPNPAGKSSFIRIYWKGLSENIVTEKTRIELYNVLGTKYFDAETMIQPYVFNCENLTTGIYFIKVQTEKGSAVKKLIVQ